MRLVVIIDFRINWDHCCNFIIDESNGRNNSFNYLIRKFSLMIYSIQSLYLIFCISRFVKDYDEDHIIEAKWKTIDK